MTKYDLSIHVDLRALLGGLQRSLQRTIDLVSLGLIAVDSAPAGALSLPQAFFQFTPAPNQKRTVETAKEEYKSWALCSGLRDCVEAISAFLEEVRTVCAVYSLKTMEEVRRADWNARMVNEPRKFHRFGLPNKLGHLAETYSLDTDLSEELLSINRARNCLVHRGGVVSERDTNDGDSLVIKWRRLEIIVRGDAGERVAEPHALFEAGEEMFPREGTASRTFHKGDSITFTPQEFSELGYTFFVFGQRLVKKIEDYGRECGVPIRESKDQPISP